MTKIDIFSGFLGAGKTTLIKKLLKEAYAGEQVVLIENEFGEIGIDSGFLQDAGINITEMNSGCICCSLVGDFTKALAQVYDRFHPDRIIIEPSGVGKLSDVIRAATSANLDGAQLNALTTVVDAGKCKMYMKNFGEFFNDQLKNATSIILSHTDVAAEKKITEALALIRGQNATAAIVTTPWDKLSGLDILAAMEQKDTLGDTLAALEHEHHEHHHDHDHDHGEHHHHDHDEHCECGCHDHEHHDHDHDHGEHHHHDHDEHCECGCHDHEHHDHDHDHGEHHHHDHDEHCECGCHDHEHHHDHDHDHGEHHHHDHDEHCECGCHDHEHHHDHDHGEHHEHHYDEHGQCSCGHHHHADEVFTSWGAETARKYTREEIAGVLDVFSESDDYGMILRAKGIVAAVDGSFIHFDYTPGEADVRVGSAAVIGRLCVIGSNIDKEKIAKLFFID